MGWTDSQLHQFERDGQYWGAPEYYPADDISVAEEWNVPLCRVLRQPRDSLICTYDFGDDWRHEVMLEATESAGSTPIRLLSQRIPLTLASSGAC